MHLLGACYMSATALNDFHARSHLTNANSGISQTPLHLAFKVKDTLSV